MRYNDCAVCGREMSQSEASPCHDCAMSAISNERDFNAASLRDANKEIARLRAKVERLKVLADGCPDSQNEDACGDCLNCLRFGMRAALDSRALALAEVERMTKERDEAAVYLRCAKCIRQGRTDATTHCVECSGDLIWKEPEHDLSDLVGCMPSFPIGSQEIGGYLRGTSTAEDAIQKTTLRTRAESAEARVEQLEAGLRIAVEWVAEEIEPCDRPTRCPWAKDHLWLAKTRALLSPQPAPLPDLLAEVLPPKCWHCSYNGTVVVKYCMRDGCPETPKFDVGGTVTFKPKPAPCGRCGGSGQVPDLPPMEESVSVPRPHKMPITEIGRKPCPDCRGEGKK